MREGGGAWRWTCGRRRRCLQGGPATWGNGFGRRGAPVQHGSPPPGGLHGLQEGGAGSRGQGRGTARRRAPGTGQIWRGEADQRQTGGVRILLAALPFVHGGPLSKGNEQRDEQRERKQEREKKGKGNGVAVLFLSPVVGVLGRQALLRSRQRRSQEVPVGLDGTRGGGGWPDAENEGG